jgi:hypothetical protein
VDGVSSAKYSRSSWWLETYGLERKLRFRAAGWFLRGAPAVVEFAGERKGKLKADAIAEKAVTAAHNSKGV